MKSKTIYLILFLFLCNSMFSQKVPEWAKEAVWYQIFPERFNNGDITNDPTIKDMEGAWPYIFPKNIKIHPWTSDWYKLQPWEVETGNDFYANVNIRRYGGDLKGVIDKLDYLTELGINAIYFNPVFESPSLHKYDASMYHHIDNNFGPNPSKDLEIWNSENPAESSTWKWTSADSLFLELINQCHKRDIKIIIDGVFNHTGTTFWAFQDVVKNQKHSKFKDWYIINSWDTPETEKNEFDYAGWYGIKDLPEFREDEFGIVSGPKEHIHEIVKRWMDPNNDGDPSDGIDGWRLDVAEMVNINFWKDFRKWVKDINPDAYITGEIWWNDWQINKMMNASPWLQGDTFDAVMNYRFTRAVKHFVSDVKNQISPQSFIDTLQNIQRDYPKENIYVLMNLLGSHDTERLASLVVNPDTWYDHLGIPSTNNNFDVRKPNATERLKQKLMIAIQMTMPGAPMIYYGDEAGMWGADDPDCRKPMVFPELNYETETTHPLGKTRQDDEVVFEQDLFDWYKKLINIRKSNREISLGELEFSFIDNQNFILAYKRFIDKNETYIIINNENKSKVVEFTSSFFNENENLKDQLSGSYLNNFDGIFKIKLAPYQIMIIK